jgi:site-specific DNA recombinase
VGGGTPLDQRPQLLEAIAALAPGDVLLVAKRDRLGRGDVLLVAMIEVAVKRKRCRIVSAAGEGTEGDDPSSILMRRMVDAFAEYEKLIIAARTKAALRAKRARGERYGPVPFGSDLAADGRRLVANEREREALALVRSWHAERRSLRAIAAALDEREYFPATRRIAPAPGTGLWPEGHRVRSGVAAVCSSTANRSGRVFD